MVQADVMTTALTLLYDGGCPLCLREVNFLRQRDQRLNPSSARIAFVDINDTNYRPEQHQGISYREAMGRIHAIQADGTVLQDVAVFREAYRDRTGLVVRPDGLARHRTVGELGLWPLGPLALGPDRSARLG